MLNFYFPMATLVEKGASSSRDFQGDEISASLGRQR
jgi:hypothetical protein